MVSVESPSPILAPSCALPFVKMHGLGNDFVILDARLGQPAVSLASGIPASLIRAIAHRRFGIGCDQVILMTTVNEKRYNDKKAQPATVNLHFYNADGSSASACGNGTCCASALLMNESGKDSIQLNIGERQYKASIEKDKGITLDMGVPCFHLNHLAITDNTPPPGLFTETSLRTPPLAINLGNPHIVFFVDDVSWLDSADIEQIGSALSHHPWTKLAFPQGVNIEIAAMMHPTSDKHDQIRMRVFERGAGVTLACGSGACATLVAACMKGITGRSAHIQLDGGCLSVLWDKDDHVNLSAPVQQSFWGTFILDNLLSGCWHESAC